MGQSKTSKSSAKAMLLWATGSQNGGLDDDFSTDYMSRETIVEFYVQCFHNKVDDQNACQINNSTRC
jgi:hypothetical protein